MSEKKEKRGPRGGSFDGGRLEAARLKAGLTREDLADRASAAGLKLSEKTIQRAESGAPISSAKARIFEKLLRVELTPPLFLFATDFRPRIPLDPTKSRLEYIQSELTLANYKPTVSDLENLRDVEKRLWDTGSELRASASITLAFAVLKGGPESCLHHKDLLVRTPIVIKMNEPESMAARWVNARIFIAQASSRIPSFSRPHI